METVYKFKKKNFIYLAPTRTGSSTINKILGMPKVHFPLDEKIVKSKTYKFATVRNPYDRILSMYNFFPMGEGTCFDDFLSFLEFSGKENVLIFYPQYKYTHWKGKQIVDDIIKLEDFKEVLTTIPLFKDITKIPHVNKDKRKGIELTSEQKERIYEMYKEDFEFLSYDK